MTPTSFPWKTAFCIGLTLPLALQAQTPPAVTNAPPVTTNAAPISANTNADLTDPKEACVALLKIALHMMSDGDLDGALVKIDAAEQLDRKNIHVYLLRGSAYGQKKLWARAQRDYEAALALSPNLSIIKFDLAELKFMQRDFEGARPQFAAIQKDPDIGDLAAYKVFLCDIMSNHEAAAAQDLAAFNQAGSHPSYYYANAAWDLSHNKAEDARGWLLSAANIYDARKNDLYSASLKDLASIRAPFVDFTTKDGKTYTHLQATLEDKGLRVLTQQNGWTSIPLDQLSSDLSGLPPDWQAEIKSRLSPDSDAGAIKVATLTTKSGQTYTDASVFVESADLRLRTAQGIVSVPFDQLPDDLSSLPPDLQKQIVAKRRPAPDVASGDKVAAFTTKQGKKYENVEVIVEETDLRVRTPDGWTSVAFDDLPDDLSAFPDDVKQQINTKRTPASDAIASTKIAHLTTRQGKSYDNVSAFVDVDGLLLRTDSGTVTVPFDQLPSDLSGLPDDLQRQIAAKYHPASSDATAGIPVPLLTTKQGQTYKDVGVFVENDGLRLRTAQGFVSISFDQLPDDLSSLPMEVQKQVAAKHHPADTLSGFKVPLLVTKDGQKYENAEVFVESDGLRLRTSSGFVTLPFEQLPKDLSALPIELRKQITARQKAPSR